ncbi:endonuclease/exonuclease/phosphatase family protein, partial [Brevundimonas sp. ZS04]|uniref:endonuclease/exonuclease/phosphatase family protein n=1 Tax=Brevundimonas sp. ZS04 TaxID=1906854 RepID=UPI0018E9B4A3
MRALLDVVRRERVDVLAVQEDTPDFTTDAAAGGLRELLPYGALRPAPGAKGVSLYSRFPVVEIPPTRYDFRSRGGVLTLPGGQRIHVRSVHPPPPFNAKLLRPWKRRLGALPSAQSGGVPTILAGDYNATLDHHPF